MTRNAKGVGVNVSPKFYADVSEHSQLFSFIELNPEEFVTDHPIASTLLSQIVDQYPIVLHSTSLSLCGDNPIPHEQIEQVSAIARTTGASLYSDHLSFTWAGNINLSLYMPPIFDDEMITWVSQRIKHLIKKMSLDFAVENVGMLVSPALGNYSEPEFIQKALEAADCLLQLNLDSVAISATTLREDPLDYLQRFPLDRIATVAYVPEICMNPIMRNLFGKDIDPLMMLMLDFVLRHSPAERVIVQRRGDQSIRLIAQHIEIANDSYRRHRRG